VLDVSQMASPFSRIKTAKLLTRDFSRQGSVTDGVNNTALIVDVAEHVGASTRLIRLCQDLFREAEALGFGSDDMISMIRAIEAAANRQ